MSKEADFLIYCMERYRYLKKLSGADVARIFEKYDIYGLSAEWNYSEVLCEWRGTGNYSEIG